MKYRRLETNPLEFKGSLTKNISQGGVRLTAYEFLPLNLKLALEIPLAPGLKSVEGVGRVAWVKKVAFGEQYEVGAQFLSLNQGDSSRIAKVILNKAAE